MSAFNVARSTPTHGHDPAMKPERASSGDPIAGAAELRRAGFTPAQIARLAALRDAYPMIELVDSRREWARLVFLKWRYTMGLTGDLGVA